MHEVCNYVNSCNAIFILYRRGRWELLKELKFSRDNEVNLMRFDMEQITSDSGLIRSVQQTKKLLDYCPQVFPSAVIALGKFRLKEKLDSDFVEIVKMNLKQYGWKGFSL